MKLVAAALSALLLVGSAPAGAAEDQPSLASLLGVGSVDPHEVTLALRDLALTLPTLSGPEARAAHRMLARPTDGGADPEGNGYPSTGSWTFTCSLRFCFHWVTTGDDAVDPTDADLNGTPDQIDLTSATMETVWDTEVTGYGLRAPKDDSTSVLPFAAGNPDGRFDVYLANIGDDSLYGYCSSDDPETQGNTRSDVSAYCVLDNDYSLAEYGAPPLNSLQVTAAHEFFHAVQFAYSYLTDSWLLESLAAWIEDEVYTDVNDNLQYLTPSPISSRGQSIDLGDPDHVYGSWIWWEFLSTNLGVTEARALVADILTQTDGAPGGAAMVSSDALATAFSNAGVHLGNSMAWFGIANATPGTSYPEGASYPASGFAASATVSSSSSAVTRSVSLNHLASKAMRFTPGQGMGAGAKLRVIVDLPRAASTPGFLAIVRFLDGSSLLRVPTLNGDGIGSLRLRFDRSVVRDVLLGFGNGSTRFDCFQGTFFSCEGRPLDNGMRTIVRTVPQP